MRSTIQSGGLSNFGSGVTRYSVIGTADIPNNLSTEAQQQVPFRTAGLLHYLTVRIPSVGASATVTVKVRKNGADGNQAISTSAGATGYFQDTTNTDSVAAGDLMDYQIVTATSTAWVVGIKCIFNASDGTLTKFATSNGGGWAKSGINTEYLGLDGVGAIRTTESDLALDCNLTGTWKNLSVYISANTRTDTTTYGTRVNGSNGALVLSVSASATGLFEDTSNTISIAANDDINYRITAAAGSGSATALFMSSELVTSDGTFQSSSSRNAGWTTNSNTDENFHISGDITTFSDWTVQRQLLPALITNLVVVMRANTLNSGVSVISPVKNGTGTGATTALRVSVAFGTTGTFEDAVSGLNLRLPTDTIAVNIKNAGTSGSTIISCCAVKQEPYRIKDVIGGGLAPFNRSKRAAHSDYTVAATTYSWETLTGAATSLTLSDDSLSAEVILPFAFLFFGERVESLKVGSNGRLNVSNTTNSGYGAGTLPNSNLRHTIFPYNADLDPSVGGTIKYETFGSAGSRKFVVQWDAVRYFDSADTATFQCKIFEADNTIEFHVQDASNDGDSSMVKYDIAQGVEDSTASVARYLGSRNNFQDALTNDAVVFTPIV